MKSNKSKGKRLPTPKSVARKSTLSRKPPQVATDRSTSSKNSSASESQLRAAGLDYNHIQKRGLQNRIDTLTNEYISIHPNDPGQRKRQWLRIARGKARARLRKIEEQITINDARHPAHPFSDLFPLMTEPRFREMCMNIKELGLIDPIVLHEGQVLDGRNRERACIALGVTPHYIEFRSLGHDCTPEEFILTRNLQRRDLTDDQRAAIALEGEERLAAEARERQRQAGGDKRSPKARSGTASERSVTSDRRAPTTREILAVTAGVSQRKILTASQIRHHQPELLTAVMEGRLSLAKARAQALPCESDKPLSAIRAFKSIVRVIDNHLRRTEFKLEFLEKLGKHVGDLIAQCKRDAVEAVDTVDTVEEFGDDSEFEPQ